MATQSRQIAEAARLALDDSAYFDQVLETIVTISAAHPVDNYEIQSQCLDFAYRAFYLKAIDSFDLRCSNAGKLVPMLSRFLLLSDQQLAHHNLPAYIIVQRSVEVLAAIYDLTFYHMIDHPNPGLWQKLCNIRDFVCSKWPGAYPLLPFNRETDLSRAISVKNAELKLIGKVIRTHLPATVEKGASLPAPSVDISISLVTKDHPYLNNKALTVHAQQLLDAVFQVLNDDVLLPTNVFSPIVSMLMGLFKIRHNYISQKFLNFILGYEAQLKRAPKWEEDPLKIRLNRRFNDRIDKVTISLLINRGFIDKDPSLKTRFQNKMRYLVEKGNDQKKRGIMDESIDAEAAEEYQQMRKKRKVDKSSATESLFYNESPIARSDNYKALYSLLRPDEKLNEFDVSSIPTDTLCNMVVAALSRVDTPRFVKALDTTSDRYCELITRNDYADAEEAGEDDAANDGYVPDVKKEEVDAEDEDQSEEEAYALPLPREMSLDQKKEQLRVIVNNFIHLASQDSKEVAAAPSEPTTSANNLEKVAISRWNNDSWIKILSRMATRGTMCNKELSDYIREAIFEYFQTDIKPRLGEVIEWLNEEYYNEAVESEELVKEEKEDEDEGEGKGEDVPGSTTHKTYILYAGKVLDVLVPFLDPTDRKVFIRLLSELPYLDKELISKLRSLCVDPARSPLGFQSLLYLIMFRPPVYDDCISLLQEMNEEAKEKNNEQLRANCEKYLKKYPPRTSAKA